MSWFTASKGPPVVPPNEPVIPSIAATRFIERQFMNSKMLKEARKDNYVSGEHMTKYVEDLIGKTDSEMKKYPQQIKSYCEAALITPIAHEERRRSDAVTPDPSSVILPRSLQDREVVQDQTVASSCGGTVFVISDAQLKAVLTDTEMKVNELNERRARICIEMDRRVELARVLFAKKVVKKLSEMLQKA